ncbi:ubiquitin carboxyl-terminal hydrolase UCHL3 [Babesia ovata]|uniref:Ubiquitin carboxyl-terminal hydrolase n=1 Tax=Babesia ovata TaxID=189622 RepID=A0A2H6KDE3_9APIC|nr:ubiquitin carboxyl-terminal hydrolase UCHL3 [Babesia ovata]GBE61013.1 ubiquitin carboxyl-terminal hydrolase UCHL3 [Babesia ovata]
MTRTRVVRGFAPLEACPVVFSEYAAALGQYKLVFDDLLAWETWAYDMVKKPVVGVIVTLPCTAKLPRNKGDIHKTKIRIAKRVVRLPGSRQQIMDIESQNVHNQCGTYALLHLLNNICENRHIENDSILSYIREKTFHASPGERGTLIENTHEIQELHAKFEQKGQSVITNEQEEIASHYVTFVVVDGDLYELDGALDFPVNHGRAAPDELLQNQTIYVLPP